MVKDKKTVWENYAPGRPIIKGCLEISCCDSGIFIGGDPAGFSSFARLLMWMANIDQEALPTQPDGERFHVHLHVGEVPEFNSLTSFSEETEVCRLDAKGTGDLPEKYHKKSIKKSKSRKTISKTNKKVKKGKK
jgi:hypothetical protein